MLGASGDFAVVTERSGTPPFEEIFGSPALQAVASGTSCTTKWAIYHGAQVEGKLKPYVQKLVHGHT